LPALERVGGCVTGETDPDHMCHNQDGYIYVSGNDVLSTLELTSALATVDDGGVSIEGVSLCVPDLDWECISTLVGISGKDECSLEAPEPCAAGTGPFCTGPIRGNGCVDCAVGKYSTAGLCKDCKCDGGRPDDDCGNAINADRTSCSQCASGTAPNADRTACVACPAGRYASEGICRLCAVNNDADCAAGQG
jgi:hypothetical protein